MVHPWLFERCREVQLSPDGHLDLWAREHCKSTIITVGKTIQDILARPGITVGIFSHTRPVARSFLRQIKRELEGNSVLQGLFPHVRPPQRGESRTWSEENGITVRRKGNPKENTVEAWGLVDGQPTGKHFDLLIYDDVVTLESVSTPEQIRKTTDAWRLSLNLGARGGRVRMIGTRYHAADTYAEILQQGSLSARIHTATVDARPNSAPVLFPPDLLASRRRDMGPYVFSCQMMQDPLSDNAMGFRPEWFRQTEQFPAWEAMNRYIVADPASSKKERADYTSMWVVGLHSDGAYYVLDGVHDRLNLQERAVCLFDLHRRWHPIAVGYERYGMQADIEHLRYLMERENYRFPLVELGGAVAKSDRIRRLVPVFEQGRMWFPPLIRKVTAEGRSVDIVEEFRKQEYLAFPVSRHDDMLDCLARILDEALAARFPGTRRGSSALKSSRPAPARWR